ncbi:MAG: hypothetical protein A3F46_08290 [Legionellales bacterium RIFCSPHIGHO2_12_FULL_42_9]|nr:MAG: hypothetical protein A3F46_08290 [Legionellales bacterium RIFCSPHIGHO2_12_FULL_42_9]
MANDTNNLPPETTLAGQPDALQPPDPLKSELTLNGPHVAVLTTEQGKSYSLTDKQLDQWFAALEKSNTNVTPSQELEEDDEGLATQLLSRFGIKGSVGVSTFLNSPEGKDITAMIREELAEIAAEEDYEQFLAAEEAKREHRLLGFLLLALIYESDADADSLNELIAAQNEQRIQHAHEAATRSPVDNAAIEHDILVEQYDAFNSAVEAVDDKLKVKNAELEAVDKTLATLDQQKQDMDAEHKVYDDHLGKLDNFLTSTAQQPNQAEAIEQQIKSLQTTMDEQLNEIQELIEKGKDDDARKILKEHQGLQLQVAGLKDMQDVLKGQKHFCDAQGNPVNSPKDAKLVLDKSKKIVKDPADGRCHLIGAHEDLQSIKNGGNAQERLNASHGHYQKALTENNSVHAAVDNNKQLKEDHHAQRHSAALKQKTSLQGDISLLSDQKTKLKASQAEVERRLVESNQARLSAPSGSLAPNTTPTFRPQPKSTRNSPSKYADLTDAINALKEDRSPAAIKRVIDLVDKTHAKGPQFEVFSNKLDEIKNMPRWAPIPEISIRSLLQNIERFGVSAEKPTIAPLDAETLAKTPEDTPEANTPDKTPTPKLKPPGF